MEFYDTDTLYVDFVVSLVKNKRRGKNPQTWRVTYASERVEDVVENSTEHKAAIALREQVLQLSNSGTTVAYVAVKPTTAVVKV